MNEKRFADLVCQIKSGCFSKKFYSIEQWEKIISPFKDPNKYTRKHVGYGNKIHGYIFNEIIPLIAVAKTVGSGCKIRWLGPEQETADGILFHKSLGNKGRQCVQCVGATDGHMESIRQEALRKNGHVKAYGDIKYKGSKRNRKIPAKQEPIAIPVNDPDAQEKFKRSISTAIDKKLKEDYKGLWLIIVFHDYMPFKPFKSSPKAKGEKIVKRIFNQILTEKQEEISKIYKKVVLVENNTNTVVSRNFTAPDHSCYQ